MDYFFAPTLHQFSFWSTKNNRYFQPLIAPIGGVERKGSDYLWAAFTRRLEKDAEFCSLSQGGSEVVTKLTGRL